MGVFRFGTMCSAGAERDAPFGRDVCFASDVCFAREDEVAFRGGEKHFYFLVLKNTPKRAIIKSE